MPAEIIWLRIAREELEDIATVIAVDSSEAARRIARSIEFKAGLLGDFPQMGPRRTDIGAGFRMLVEGPYLILYRTVPDTDDDPVSRIEIVSIVDGRRDLGVLF